MHGIHDDMTIHVVGGSGFIGTRLCHRLQLSGADFAIVDKAQSRAFPSNCRLADVRDIEALRGVVGDGIIVNLAAEHRDDVQPRSLYDAVNVDGARNIAALATEKAVRTIVFTSTVAVYGFAEIGTDEGGTIAPFNDYGRTKYEAENVLTAWQQADPDNRALVIIRPTVVFGERNRGNVYNLLRQIASGRFVMVGKGENRKSIAYVENVAAFIEYALSIPPGISIFNYVDKPDFTMNALIGIVFKLLGKPEKPGFRLPQPVAALIGHGFDLFASLTGRKFAISAVRVQKFCANSVYATAVEKTDFVPPVELAKALEQTVRYEFLESHQGEELFYSE